jgi:hypothetical protein
MSPDWSAKVEPVPYSKLEDPQSLNLYAYVRNNPLGGVDSNGHEGTAAEATAQAAEDWIFGSTPVQFDGGKKKRPAAQQQDATARREQAAEANAKKNMDKYGPANNGLTIRPVAGSCGGGNHNCQYELVGNGSEKYYVYEHQTSSGILGGDPQGTADYVTPGYGGKANTGIFYDDIGGTMDTYRFFTISTSETYNPSDQHYVPIDELGGLHGFEHMYSSGGDVYINGSTNLSPSN